MSRKKPHRDTLPSLIERYATPRALNFHQYSPFHMRLIDTEFTVLDCWTTGKYWVKQTNYNLQTSRRIIERGDEKGWLPVDEKLEQWLDKLFYAADMENTL